jgi:hypothetical protein
MFSEAFANILSKTFECLYKEQEYLEQGTNRWNQLPTLADSTVMCKKCRLSKKCEKYANIESRMLKERWSWQVIGS